VARFTSPDGVGAPGPTGATGPGVPSGGNAGDILAKIDGADYNTEWIENYTSTVKHLVKYVGNPTIPIGTPVYAVLNGNGNSSTNIPVNVASNASEATSSKTMGLIEDSVAKNGFVYVVTEGLVAGIDTSTANTGDPVWLGENGAYIFGLANKPTAPAHLVFLGVVTRGQQVNGEIFVKVQNGFELDELHTVSLEAAASISNNEVLAFDSASGLWKNKTIGEVLSKASGFVNAGVDVTLGNLKARIPTSGNRSLQLSTVTGTYSVYGSGVYSQNGVSGTTITEGNFVTITTTPTYLVPSYQFTVAGATDTWIIRDLSNTIAWRITLVIGGSFNNNFISIEKL
jgi:hypothetical protein